jgi:hypothetical protein
MKRSLLYIICLLAFLASCSDVKIPSQRPEIVVEGWIEDGGFPVVIVTSSIPIDTEYHEWDEIGKYIIRWAKVSVSDGEREVVLVGGVDKDYFPPYIYTTSRMMGEAGKTYTLKVEYSGRVETATTTVPASVPLEYVKVVKKDGGYGVLAGLKDNRQTKDYYRFFSMVEGHDSTYVPSFLGLVDDAVLSDGVNEIYVNGAFNDNWGTVEKSPTHYEEDDVVRLRLSTMDEVSYAYWSDYDDVASLSTNQFFPVNKKIRSNVSSGMGYWAGYGSSYYKVSIPDSLAMGRVF